MNEPLRQPRPGSPGVAPAALGAVTAENQHDVSGLPDLGARSAPRKLVIRVVFHKGDSRHGLSLARLAAWVRSNHRALLLIGAVLLSAGLVLLIASSGSTESGAARPTAAPAASRAPLGETATKVRPEDRLGAATSKDKMAEPGAQAPAVKAGSSGQPPGGDLANGLPNGSVTASPPTAALIGPRKLLRSVQLVNFSWRPDSKRQTLLVDLTVRNKSARQVDQIEVVCSQHARDLTLLETSKMRVQGTVEPNTQRVFRAVAGGPLNRSTHRVHCLISDVFAAAAPATD